MMTANPARLLLVATILLFTACLQPMESGGLSVSLIGRWEYSATQTGASAEAVNGTLMIGQQSGASFQGTLAVTSISAGTGEVRSLAGTVSGSSPASGTIDFDAFMEQTPRRHVARLIGDTLAGTWVRVSDGVISASGTFSAHRVGQ